MEGLDMHYYKNQSLLKNEGAVVYEKPEKSTIEPRLPFVTLEDVETRPIDLNYVLYNPKLPFEERKAKLNEITKLVYEFSLTEGQLNRLCKLDCNQFVEEFRFIKKHQ